MAKKKTGLEAIFGEGLSEAFNNIENFGTEKTDASDIKVSDIKPNPYQPRRVFDEDKLKELAGSIKEHGVFTPIIIKKDVKGYLLVAGERRWRASQLAKKTTIPAIVVDFNDEQMQEIALIENIQREQLNAIEEAQAYNNLKNTLKLTQEQLAKKVSKKRAYIANSLRLLTLPKKVQDWVLEGKISAGHVKAVAGLDDDKLIISIIQRAIDEKLSVRKVEEIVKGHKLSKLGKKPKKVTSSDFEYVESLLRKKLGTKVTIDKKEIKIKFTTISDLNRLLELIGVIE